MIEEELGKIAAEYSKTRSQCYSGLKLLEERCENYEEPESLFILQAKIEKEKEYLQRTIIQMELKQLAESLAILTYRKKLKRNVEKDQINLINRPLLWAEKLQEIEKQYRNKLYQTNDSYQAHKHQYMGNDFWKVNDKYMYCVKFDPSLGIEDTWIDPETMNFLNAQRDNIYVSSSKYDVVTLRSIQLQYHTSTDENIPNLIRPAISERQSLEPAIGTKKKVNSTSQQAKKKQQKSEPHQGEQKGQDDDKANYGFCHHCKQLKNKFLLASCNYNSAAMGPTVPASYCVKDVKIYNIDIGNRTSLNYLIQQHIGKNQKGGGVTIIGGIATPYVVQDQSFQSGNKSSHQKKKNSRCRQVPSNEEFQITADDNYSCTRKFCSFCLKTNYEENFSHCYSDKSWICPFCQGVCFCTRCLRQDTMTQLKAYFMALGGDLNILQSATSIFDKMILENFQLHLQLTLLSNPHLSLQYPQYAQLMGMPVEIQEQSQAPYSNNVLNELSQISPKKYKTSTYNQLGFIENTPCFNTQQEKTITSVQSQYRAGNRLGFVSYNITPTSQILKGTPTTPMIFSIGQGQPNLKFEQEKNQYTRLYEYCLLQINEEERAFEKRSSLSKATINSIKSRDAHIVDKLKKRRGRKKFILIDSSVKLRLSKRQQKILDKVRKMRMMVHTNPEQPEFDFDSKAPQKEEHELLEEINKSREQIENREVINKEKVINLPLKQKKRDHKRRRGTHFTQSKSRKRKREIDI